jgi:ABC-type Fe3+-hydroxamate transport system substrate-binding protein
MTFEDQMGRSVQLTHWPPRRIISLVPSQTEFFHYIGLDAQIVGITKFCVKPAEWFATKTRIGGTKTLHLEKIKALQPDLIIGNKEENERAQIETLSELFPVWMSDVLNLPDALDMMRRAGHVCGRSLAADALAADISRAFDLLPLPVKRPRALYLIWRKPYMAAASGTFVQDMLQRAGFENVLADQCRYPQISTAALQRADPDVILLSSEPFPFSEKHIRELKEICPRAQVHLADGELFSWYGPRMLHAPAYFQQLNRELGIC